jgi:3-oxoacyl-[acyl-carrier protein] reductase
MRARTNKTRLKALIFGASGAIGEAVTNTFASQNFDVYCVSRSEVKESGLNSGRWIGWAVGRGRPSEKLEQYGPYDAVAWCQGANINDSIYNFNTTKHLELYHANILFVLESLSHLLASKLISNNAKMCIISSIWQEISRKDKLSYSITKSAIAGLVRSLTADLGSRGILVNAILPGALDTPMTRSNLDTKQIKSIEEQTPLHSLASLSDVSNLLVFLCSDKNTGITGQFIFADRGFSYVRHI